MLDHGTKLGTYEISSHIGSGGMGDVYQAHDSKLDRDVAIKVLPEQFARDSERLARFQREAKLLAALNHPNIAAIYGLEQSGSTHYLVMELVPGQTLREKIAGRRSQDTAEGGCATPVEEALAIARQIAEALEAAHNSEKGIIHRDLKPANVKVTPEGRVKVLDFGLAKAFAAEQSTEDMANSPTLSAAPTMQGVIMGTAAYMSPEQARGRAVTKSADIWAFGAVLYELLTGKQAFQGEDVTDIIAAVVRAEPDWKQLPEATPPAVHRLLRRCLRKDRRQRLQDAIDARLEIEEGLAWLAEGGAQAGVVATAGPAPIGRLAFPGRLGWVVAGIAIAVASAGWGAFAYFRPAPGEQQAVRFSVSPPGSGRFFANPSVLSVSPDGSKLVFIAQDSPTGPMQLWVRTMDSEAAQVLPGTANSIQAFWAPDSRFLAFYAEGKLKRIPVTGGPAQTLADAPVGGDHGDWSREGVVLFAPRGVTPGTIYRVSSAGGRATPVTALDASRQETSHGWPYFLPDENHFLYLARSSNPENIAVFVSSLDSPDKKLVLNVSSNVVYVPPGYLIFNREGTLVAQAFDAERLELTGEEVPIAEDVQFNVANGRAAFAVSGNGVLTYRTATGAASTELQWFDRTGKQIGVLGEPAIYGDLEFSPDGRQSAVTISDPPRRPGDIWLFDLARNLKTQFTFDPADESSSAWSPDGSRLVFGSGRKGFQDLYVKNSSGAGTDELLFEDSVSNKFPQSWSPDGRSILYFTPATATRSSSDLFVLPLSGDPSAGSGQAGQVRKPVPFLQTQFTETRGRFSPDGRWVAYVSNESRRGEVYVAAYPGPGGKRLVSTAGGALPRWRRDGAEIFYLAPDNKLMVAKVNGRGESVDVGVVSALFETRARVGGGYNYDVSPDGQRFLIITSPEQASSAPITVVVNWMAGMRK